MTTIAYRTLNDCMEIAVDSRFTLDGRTYESEKFSFARGPELPSLVAVAGDICNIPALCSWQAEGFCGGKLSPPTSNGTALVFKRGKVYLVSMERKCLEWVGLPYWGIGSGRDIAVGMMACGLSPGAAIAKMRDENLDDCTGGEVHQFRMDKDGAIIKLDSL